MRRKWRTFHALAWTEQRLLVGVMLLFPWVELALRLRGMRWTQSLLARTIPPAPVHDGLSPEVINRIVRQAAGAGPYHATCLRRSLVLWWLLRRRGVTCEIRIGAAHSAASFTAHAWVEWEGGQSDSPQILKRFAVFEGLSQPKG